MPDIIDPDYPTVSAGVTVLGGLAQALRIDPCVLILAPATRCFRQNDPDRLSAQPASQALATDGPNPRTAA